MNHATSLSIEPKSMQNSLKPIGMVESLLLFGIPAAALAFTMLWLWPALTRSGMDRPAAYALCITLVCAGLLFASIVGYVLEGNPLTWTAFADRMRLTGLKGRVWLWFLLGLLIYFILSWASSAIQDLAYRALHFTPPNTMNMVIPVWMSAVVLFFNIAGEELWWRGYILPRQELAFGRWTWLLHGILWACFHIFKWYEVPFLMMITWVIPLIVMKTKNTWLGIIYHTIYNVVGLLLSAA